MTITDLGPELLATIARLHRWATAHAELEIAPAHARLLSQVEATGPARTSELARADHCSQPTMTTQLHRLEQLGWVTRLADPTDGRASLVQITPDGRSVLERVRRAREQAIAPLLEQLSADERRQLSDGLTVVRRLMTLDTQPA